MPEKTLLARTTYRDAAVGTDAPEGQPAPQYQGLFLEPDLPRADDED